ncbi:hypothetical protein [Bacillus atrophaeus]|uniref:hypothetical protein n=1 Tax=Bacillus atrophaeus TaxID=1452 RepID=UPI0028803958|nr:hypothetical protein [Bacillus atrophaeus]MDS9998625.1 hypothetical protein [Bacillus atrophaeus]
MGKNILRDKVYEQARHTLECEIPAIEESIKDIDQEIKLLETTKAALCAKLNESQSIVEESIETFNFVRHFFLGSNGSKCGWLLLLDKEFLSDKDGYTYEMMVNKRHSDREHGHLLDTVRFFKS